ncbi:MAG TPA: hypothetical protein VF832_05005 [Longimicrobiales bacterium]
MGAGDPAREALERYRRGAAERGEAAACLLERARRLEQLEGRQRRRSELVERAVRDSGLSWESAEEVYDLAEEEGLDPALALELLHCGVLVRGPREALPTEIRGDTVLQAAPPEWIAGPPPAEAEARRERRLRGSFRLLRRLLQEHGTAEAALAAYAEEPDVAPPD